MRLETSTSSKEFFQIAGKVWETTIDSYTRREWNYEKDQIYLKIDFHSKMKFYWNGSHLVNTSEPAKQVGPDICFIAFDIRLFEDWPIFVMLSS